MSHLEKEMPGLTMILVAIATEKYELRAHAKAAGIRERALREALETIQLQSSNAAGIPGPRLLLTSIYGIAEAALGPGSDSGESQDPEQPEWARDVSVEDLRRVLAMKDLGR